MVEEVKLVNDSVMCFSQYDAILLNKSQSLKTVIWPWKILEKSLKCVCLKLYESWHRKKYQIPIFGYFRVLKEYPQKSQIWKSETSGIFMGIL